MKILHLILSLFIFLLFSCDDIDNPNYYEYQETKCSDKWGNLNELSDDAFSDSIQNFLIHKSIFIDQLNIRFDSSYYSLCKSCYCTTGRLIILRADDQYGTELQDIGFTKLFDE